MTTAEAAFWRNFSKFLVGVRAHDVSRTCDGCGRTYARRNLVITWQQVPNGAKPAWRRTTRKVCPTCAGSTLP